MPSPFSKILQVVVVGKLHGQETNNVYHFGQNPGEVLLIQIAIALVTCIISSFRPMAGDDWQLEKVTVRELFPVLSDPVDYVHSVTVNGGGLPSSPSFCANLMRIRTGKGGRSNRGRIFLPAVIENDVNNSRLTDDAMTRFEAFCLCLALAFIKPAEGPAPQWEIGVLSRTRSKLPGMTIETAFTPATTLRPVREVARMGSRKIGVGS